MKILFVLTEISQKFGPLRMQHGMASISAVLKQNGFTDVEAAPFADKEDLDNWESILAEKKPDIVGFYSTAEQFHFVTNLVERTPPGIFTICGGPHPTCFPRCIEDIERLDAICVGEGEYPMVELATALTEGGDVTSIKNLWVRKNGVITRNETRPFMQDLNSLPFEDRELLSTQESIDKYGLSQVRVMTTRGCPYECTYCSNKAISKKQSGRYVRFRSAEHIMDELNELKSRYNFEEIFFDDDIFMLNKAVRQEFCDRYPVEIGKPFVFCGRVESCTPEMLKRLKQAGGRRIDFGVEAGNEELRRNVLRRRMTNDAIVNATSAAKEAGLQVKTLNMVGLPDETPAKHMDTVRINQRIKPDVASIFVFCPYPGTYLYDYCVEKGYYDPSTRLPDDYVSRRESLLKMPGYAKSRIERDFVLFGFKVFWKFAPIKAVGLTVMHSRHGEFFLEVTKTFRKMLRRILKGY